jgi:ABC-type branched-subunit amino acid transport system substrate-binding protein
MTSKFLSLKSILLLLLVLMVIISSIIVFNRSNQNSSNILGAVENSQNQNPKPKIKIGIITDLSGPASGYWGLSTQSGAQLAQKDLKDLGYNVEILLEDYKLDAPQSLNAAKKLIEIDGVDAIYAEFNPAAYTISPYMKDKNKLLVLEAAATSPLNISNNILKTYLDYQVGCKEIAQKFKNDGITKIGSLKVNLEFGELCDKGVKEVFPDTITEDYNLGDTDFKNQMLKFSSAGTQAVINTGFENDTLNSLKAIKEQNLNIKYGTVADTITPNVTSLYQKELLGGYSFGFKDVDPALKNKLKQFDPKIVTDIAAALTYKHVSDLTKSLSDCNKEINCSREKFSNSISDTKIGFKGFNQARIAEFEMEIKKL